MLAQQTKKIQREERILSSLDDLTYATREQLQIINELGGDRNAHRILHRMERERLIASIRTERKIYFLGTHGKSLIGSAHVDLRKESNARITHTLLRNDVYIALGMPKNWVKEEPATWGDNKLIPDASFTKNNVYQFVEVDNQQTMAVNYEKIRKYGELSKVIFNQFGAHPTLIWRTVSDIRREKLRKACVDAGVKFEII